MPEQGKDFQHEADFLAAFLEHDNTPKDMCDYIGGLVFDVAGSVSLRTPAVLRVAWPLIRQQEHASSDALWWAIIGALRSFADEETDRILDEISEATRVRREDCGTEASTEGDAAEDAPNGHMVIAQHLSAILAHPATPGPVREEILAVLGSIDTEADTDPRHLAFILAAHANKEALKGGAS